MAICDHVDVRAAILPDVFLVRRLDAPLAAPLDAAPPLLAGFGFFRARCLLPSASL